MAQPFFTNKQYQKFNDVDSWICSSLLPPDEGLDSALKANENNQLDSIDVAPNQGKLLYLLAKMNNSKRVLEVGTLGGYSAIWLAKALPSAASSKIITLEIEEEHARVARQNIANAGFESVVEVKLGPAMQTLEEMGKQGTEPFDFVFIDADKENNAGYLKWSLEFSHVGTVIVVDNVVRRGRVVDIENQDPQVAGVRNLFEMMKKEPRLECTAVQTVGSKGWDGFAMGLVIA
jgi:predicted O-methyltransferase YrrM